MDIAQEMLTMFHYNPDLLKKVITGNESWVYGYDIATKAQSSQWKRPEEPRPKKARQFWSNMKVLLTVFIDCNGVMHHELLPQGRMVNKEYYLEIMRRLRNLIIVEKVFANRSGCIDYCGRMSEIKKTKITEKSPWSSK